MKKDWKYILYLSLAFGLFLAVKLMEPRQFNWTPSYAAEDKNPFGAWVLNEILPGLFPGRKIDVSNLTLYEIKDSLGEADNVIILTHAFDATREDAAVLLSHAENRASVFIASESFSGKLADTLKLATYDYLFKNGLNEQRRDSSFVRFVNPKLDTSSHYVFRRENIHNYFVGFDSTRTSIIAENDFQEPVAIRMQWGKGNFILLSIPLAFTNIYALKEGNHKFISTSLSYLKEGDVHWTQFYSIGRMEAATPLRYILTHAPLAWAYYISVTALLLFMVLEARRKQRAIPVIKPLENTSLEFVGTIANLYYQRGDHKNIAEKKILFFFDQLRSRYRLNPNEAGENFIAALSGKSGVKKEEVHRLFQIIQSLRAQAVVKKEELVELSQSLEKFTLKVN